LGHSIYSRICYSQYCVTIYFFLLTFSPQLFMLSLCSLFSNDVLGELFRRALPFYTQKAGRYNVPSHLIFYKQIVRAQINMCLLWDGERGINWFVTFYVLAVEPIEVCSQYSNFRFALLRLNIEWNYCSLNLLFEKLNGI
jgi:hypothetical protein